MERMRFEKIDWLKLIVALSAASFSVLTTRFLEKIFMVIAILFVVVVFYLAVKKVTIPNFKKVSTWIFLAIACYIIYQCYWFCIHVDYLSDWKIEGIRFWVFLLSAFLSLPFVFYAVNLIGEKCLVLGKKLYQEATLADKIVTLCVVVASFVVAYVICAFTNVFFNPAYEGFINQNSGTHEVWFDVLFTSDSGHLYIRDAFTNPSCTQNDIRQPFFAMIATPFSIVAKIFSLIIPMKDSFAAALIAQQLICVYACALMMSRMLGFKGMTKYAFVLFFCASSGNFFLAFILEQYAYSVFFLMLGLTYAVEQKREARYLIPFAAGGLAPTVLFAPMITTCMEKKSFKEGAIAWIVDCLKMACFFFFCICVYGQLTQFAPQRLKTILDMLMEFTGEKVSFVDRLYQYSYFVSSLFVTPQFRQINESLVWDGVVPSLQLNVPTGFSILGIILFVLAIVSFVLCRKEKLAQISIYWIACSLLILIALGWGAQENGMILYTMYFAWAFIALYAFAIRKLCRGNQIALTSVFGAVGLLLFILNLIALIGVIQFGLQYYFV